MSEGVSEGGREERRESNRGREERREGGRMEHNEMRRKERLREF